MRVLNLRPKGPNVFNYEKSSKATLKQYTILFIALLALSASLETPAMQVFSQSSNVNNGRASDLDFQTGFLTADDFILVEAGINQEAWIDPEVVELNGISVEEPVRYKNPPGFDHIGDPVPQPTAGTGRPEYSNMDEAFAAAFDLPDEVVTREMSENTPPVKVA